jgi:hypothetical protein
MSSKRMAPLVSAGCKMMQEEEGEEESLRFVPYL